MDHTITYPAGSSMTTFIDKEISHIGRVMRPSLQGDLGGPILPATYWRKRLNHLLDAQHLTQAQLFAVDSLLLQLDRFDQNCVQHV